MPPSSISKAIRTASRAFASSILRGSSTSSLPAHAGHWPYGKAKPSLTLPQSLQRQEREAVPQQMYSSSPSMGWWHLGQVLASPLATLPEEIGCIGSNFATSSAVTGHFLPF